MCYVTSLSSNLMYPVQSTAHVRHLLGQPARHGILQTLVDFGHFAALHKERVARCFDPLLDEEGESLAHKLRCLRGGTGSIELVHEDFHSFVSSFGCRRNTVQQCRNHRGLRQAWTDTRESDAELECSRRHDTKKPISAVDFRGVRIQLFVKVILIGMQRVFYLPCLVAV